MNIYHGFFLFTSHMLFSNGTNYNYIAEAYRYHDTEVWTCYLYNSSTALKVPVQHGHIMKLVDLSRSH